MRQLWGTFAVNDHVGARPFAEDVLMYDRLVIPYPGGAEERSRWEHVGWDPDRLDKVLERLKTDGEENKRHAIKVYWNDYSRGLFAEKMSTAGVVDSDAKLPLHVTRRLLANELRPEEDAAVTRVDAVAAYRTLETLEQDWVENAGGAAAAEKTVEAPLQTSEMTKEQMRARRAQLTLALTQEFLVPDPEGKSDFELLEEAVGLADDGEFQQKRRRMYEWQDGILRDGIRDAKALTEMEQYVFEYNAATEKAVHAVYKKFAFTLIPIALTAMGGPLTAPAAAGAVVSLVKFWIYDRKPKVEAGESEVAAMFHYAHEKLGWREASRK